MIQRAVSNLCIWSDIGILFQLPSRCWYVVRILGDKHVLSQSYYFHCYYCLNWVSDFVVENGTNVMLIPHHPLHDFLLSGYWPGHMPGTQSIFLCGGILPHLLLSKFIPWCISVKLNYSGGRESQKQLSNLINTKIF